MLLINYPPIFERYYTLLGHKCQVQTVKIPLLDLTKEGFRTSSCRLWAFRSLVRAWDKNWWFDLANFKIRPARLGCNETGCYQSRRNPSQPIWRRPRRFACPLVSRKTSQGASQKRSSGADQCQNESQTGWKVLRLDSASELMLKQAMTEFGLSARAHDKICKVVRTIADLAGEQIIRPEYIAEAISYRTLDKKIVKSFPKTRQQI